MPKKNAPATTLYEAINPLRSQFASPAALASLSDRVLDLDFDAFRRQNALTAVDTGTDQCNSELVNE
jgi:hypothetical protein